MNADIVGQFQEAVHAEDADLALQFFVDAFEAKVGDIYHAKSGLQLPKMATGRRVVNSYR